MFLLDQVDLIGYNITMKTLQLAEAKTHFSSVMHDIQAGNEVAIAYGKKKQTIAVIIPYEQWKKSKKRELGSLKDKVKVKFSKDFKMSDEELINS
jgi:antitoxin (DNA-binding transcriptional repressor) of toxin-antitoxin stability system